MFFWTKKKSFCAWPVQSLSSLDDVTAMINTLTSRNIVGNILTRDSTTHSPSPVDIIMSRLSQYLNRSAHVVRDNMTRSMHFVFSVIKSPGKN